jgi:hypothetical protein
MARFSTFTVSSLFCGSKGIDGHEVRDIALIVSEIILGSSRVLESMWLWKHDIQSACKDSVCQCLLQSFLTRTSSAQKKVVQKF